MNAICLTESGKLLLSNNNEVQTGDIDGPVTSFKTYLTVAEPPAEESGSFSHVVPYGLEDAFVADREPESFAGPNKRLTIHSPRKCLFPKAR